MIAEFTNMIPRKFVHMVGDCHIYTNHIPQIEEQINRLGFPAPSVTIKSGLLEDILGCPVNYHGLDYDKLASYVTLSDYRHRAAIKGEVAV